MGFWQNLCCWLTFKPMPLNQDWQDFGLDQFKQDQLSPVQVLELDLGADKMVLRKYISAFFLRRKIQELIDCLYYMSSEDGRNGAGFIHLREEDEYYFGDLDITWRAATAKDGKPQLNLEPSEEMDEATLRVLRHLLLGILHPLRSRPQVGFKIKVKLCHVHPKWKVPKAYEHLSFL